MNPRAVVVMLLALVSGACNAEPEPTPGAVSTRGVRPVTSTKNAPASAEHARVEPRPAAPEPTWPEERKRADVTPTAKPALEPKRDYSAELVAALGDTSSCVKPRVATAVTGSGEIAVEVEAYFVAAGSVSRSYVRSNQLGREESECIRRRVESLRLRTPIEEAPRVVRGSLKLAFKSQAKAGG